MCRKNKKINKIFEILFYLLIIVIISPRIKSVLKSFSPFVASIKQIYQQRNTSYKERFTIKYPITKSLIPKIKQYTPENSVLYLPNTSMRFGDYYWPLSSKTNMYALINPRNVVKKEESGSFEKIDNMPTYIIIFDNYPNEKIEASEIIIFSGSEDNSYYQDYDPEIFKDQIGLIKL